MKTLFRILAYGKKYYPVLIVTVVALILVALTNFVTPTVVRALTADLQNGGLTSKRLLIFAVVLISSYLIRAVCRFLSMWLAHVAAWGIVADLTEAMYDKLLTFSPSFYDNRRTGQLMSRVINDTRSLEVLFAHALPDLMVNLMIVIGVGVAIVAINPILGALTLIPLPFVLAISTLYTKKVAPLFKRNQRFLGELNASVQDKLSGIKEVQSNSGENKERVKMKDMAKYYVYVNVFANKNNALYQPTVELLTLLGTAIVLTVGGTGAINGTIAAADLVGFFMFLSLFYTPLTTLGRVIEDVNTSMAGADRILEIMDSDASVPEAENPVILDRVRGDIAFENVDFGYSDSEPVLKNVSFTVPAGKTVAFVGATGVGKSTIASLVERFYDVGSGRITLDNVDIRDLSLKCLRENISIVMQDPFLFNATIYDNIAYGVQKCTPEQVFAAAKKARVDEFTSEFPDGYQTQVGERGVQLSGGQKQRIAIARALLRNTPIIIFDEATSAVDTGTESEIQRSVNELKNERTVMIIAHRLSTVRNADEIIVLSNGSIAERGTHDQLTDKNGIYASLEKSGN